MSSGILKERMPLKGPAPGTAELVDLKRDFDKMMSSVRNEQA